MSNPRVGRITDTWTERGRERVVRCYISGSVEETELMLFGYGKLEVLDYPMSQRRPTSNLDL